MIEKTRRAPRARHTSKYVRERTEDYNTYDAEKDCERWWVACLGVYVFLACVFPYIAEAVLL